MAAEGPLHELGRDPDHQLRLPGHGPHRRDAASHVPAGRRDEGWRAGDRGRSRRSAASARGDRRTPDDNERVLRYLAKCTTEPSIVHGISGRGRFARARTHGRHRPVVADPLRREAADGDQGRASSRGARWARATRACTAPSRPATAPTGAGSATPRRGCRRRSSRRPHSTRTSPPRPGAAWSPVQGTRGITRDALLGTAPRRATSRSHPSTAP